MRTSKHAIVDAAARAKGFKGARDFHRHISAVDLSTPDKLAAYRKWREEDGTKEGMLKLKFKYPVRDKR